MNAVLAPRSRIVLELLVVAALAAWFVATFRERPSYVDLSAAFLAVGLIGLSARTAGVWPPRPLLPGMGSAMHRWDAYRTMALATIPVLVVFLIGGIVLGYREAGSAGSLERVANWHFLAAAVLYFPWALLQQFIFQYYLLGRLLALLPPGLAIAVTALAFSAVHFPRTPVMLGTALAGLVWASHYRRHRALLPLALSHALLGAAMHYWLFGNDLLDRWLGGG